MRNMTWAWIGFRSARGKGWGRYKDIVTCRFSENLVAGLAQPVYRRGALGPFEDDAVLRSRECCLHEFTRIWVSTHHIAQVTHLLFDEGRFGALGMHGIDQHDLG